MSKLSVVIVVQKVMMQNAIFMLQINDLVAELLTFCLYKGLKGVQRCKSALDLAMF